MCDTMMPLLISDANGLTHWYVWSYVGWQALKVTVGELTSLKEQREEGMNVGLVRS